MNKDAANVTIEFQNVRWLKDEFEDYWVADLLHNGKRIGITGSYYSLNKEGTARLSREEQEKNMEENLQGDGGNEKPFDWFMQFDERQRKEIDFARLYTRQFAHGTDGHNAKMIISKMADMLDKYFLTGKHD